MSDFEIKVMGLDEYRNRMQKGPEVVKGIFVRTVNFLTGQGRSVSQRLVGVDTGRLRSSISQTKATFAGGEVRGAWGTNVPYARHHETGRPPGKMPPIDAIQGWATRHGANAFLVARAIGRRGTKGKFFMRDAKAKIEPLVRTEFAKARDQIVKAMGG